MKKRTVKILACLLSAAAALSMTACGEMENRQAVRRRFCYCSRKPL